MTLLHEQIEEPRPNYIMQKEGLFQEAEPGIFIQANPYRILDLYEPLTDPTMFYGNITPNGPLGLQHNPSYCDTVDFKYLFDEDMWGQEIFFGDHYRKASIRIRCANHYL